ncbi:MAG: hypothetical protein E5V60_03845 [Mesorhizobium sp.]|nr:MAG: hypothetical protein E5V60_03845 [Mesorhizobium sp.]
MVREKHFGISALFRGQILSILITAAAILNSEAYFAFDMTNSHTDSIYAPCVKFFSSAKNIYNVDIGLSKKACVEEADSLTMNVIEDISSEKDENLFKSYRRFLTLFEGNVECFRKEFRLYAIEYMLLNNIAIYKDFPELQEIASDKTCGDNLPMLAMLKMASIVLFGSPRDKGEIDSLDTKKIVSILISKSQSSKNDAFATYLYVIAKKAFAGDAAKIDILFDEVFRKRCVGNINLVSICFRHNGGAEKLSQLKEYGNLFSKYCRNYSSRCADFESLLASQRFWFSH